MKAILFDLDGTLLPLDMDEFTAGYFRLLARKAAGRGYDPNELTGGIWQGTYAMIKNDGAATNMERFWSEFARLFGDRVYDDIPMFDSFYAEEFQEAVRFTTPSPEKARAAVSAARDKAETLVLATNPLFPGVGVETRLSWLGLTGGDFDYVSTYENSTFCKPNPLYYKEITDKLRLSPGDCLMIGNDVDEDILASERAGMSSYLVTDCLINKSGSRYASPAGSFDDMLRMLVSL